MRLAASRALAICGLLQILLAPLVLAACRGTVDPAIRVSGWGINTHNHRFITAAAAGITAGTVTELRLKWAFALPGTEAPRFLPLLTANTVVVADDSEAVYALDRETGCIRWQYEVGSMVRTALQAVTVAGRTLLTLGTIEADVIALDLATGERVWQQRVSEHPQAMVSGSHAQAGDLLIQPVSSWEVAWAANPFHDCCDFRGPIVALNATNGKIQWRAYTIQQRAEVQQKRWLLGDHQGPSGAPVWSQPTVDSKRGRWYVGTGENYSLPATGTSDAILAYSTSSGELLWAQQLLADDVWNVSCELPFAINCPQQTPGPDYDFGAPPILVNASGRDLLLAGQKSGAVFALDPDRKGRIVWRAKPGAGGKAGGVHFAMAVNPERGELYVPISDRDVGFFGSNPQGEPNPSLHALDIATGKTLWHIAAPGDCLGQDSEPIDKCFRGFSAAPTATDELVFAPTLDGVIRAFDARSGEQLWAHDTLRDYPAVNGGKARGGSIDYGGVFLDAGQLFVSSGYGMVGQIPGNAFLVFEVSE